MRVLIVDDEALARSRMRALLGEFTEPKIEIVGEAADGRAAIELCDQLDVQAVLLDISMPVMDGLEAARHLAAGDSPPAIIFCTAYDEHALAAFEARAIDYLVKPVRVERLQAALLRAEKLSIDERRASVLQPSERSRSHLCARVRGNLRLVAISEISYLLAEDKYVVVHSDQGEVLIEESLKALELEFPDQFVRIHRNCLIAISRLQGLDRDAEGNLQARVLGAPKPLEISRRCLPAVRTLVKQL
jgi:two-component system, LytTR family, response regulator AlgR